MSRLKDGQELTLEAELVFQWVEGDESVGLNSGVMPVGIRVGQRTHYFKDDGTCSMELPAQAIEDLCDRAYSQAGPNSREDF